MTKVVSDVANYITTLESSPAFKSDVAAVLAAAPASVLQEASSDPEALLDDLANSSEDDLPAWVSAIPTSVLGSLETLAAKPLDAVSDVEDYAYEVADEPEVSTALEVLATAVPTSVQAALESDPVAFIEAVATATTLPTWVSAIPAPVQSEIGKVANGALSIVASDLEGTAAPSLPTAASQYLHGAAYATGTGGLTSVTVANGTKPTGAVPSPSAFPGAAVSAKSVGIGMVAVMAGAGLLLNA